MTIEERLAEINAREPEPATAEDLAAIAAAENEEATPYREFLDSLDGYSGKLVLRLPKSLHRRLKEEAAAEGCSLNQYLVYKLSQNYG